MARIKLDDYVVARLSPRTSETTGKLVNYVAWDEEIHGFGLQVAKSGAKSWVLKYIWGRRQEWFAFASYPGLTARAARQKALAMKDGLKDGVDPKAKRDEIKKARTVAEVAAAALEEHWRPNNRDRSVSEIEDLLDQWILPRLGKRLVKDITTLDVTLLHQEIAAQKRPRGGVMKPMTTRANRVLACMSKMFALTELWGDRPQNSNPCKGVVRKPETKRKRYLKPKEVELFARALTAVEPRFTLGVAALRLLLFTGARKSEILGLRWSWVDLDEKVLRLPAEAHKTGNATGDAKVIVLNDLSISVLQPLYDSLRTPTDGGLRLLKLPTFVFPGATVKVPATSVRAAWEAALKAANDIEKQEAEEENRYPKEVLQDLRVHDLRHAFASFAIGTGANLSAVGALLGHTQAATTQRYAHLLDDPLRAAAQGAGEAMAKAMRGAK